LKRGKIILKSEEQIKKELINKLREQADRLERGDFEALVTYKVIRQQIPILEDILELNTYK
jgi:hypothetical protein